MNKFVKSSVVCLSLLGLACATYGSDGDYGHFRKKRSAPQIERNVHTVINVSKFGAQPNDTINDWGAFCKAFSKATSHNRSFKVVIPAGRYVITPPKNQSKHCFSLNDCSDFVIDGTDAEIIITNPTVGLFSFSNCSNATIRGLSSDYSTLPYTQGRVSSIDVVANTLDVTIDPDYPLLSMDHFRNAPQRWGIVCDTYNDEIQLKHGLSNLIPTKDIEQINDRTFRVKSIRQALSGIVVGDQYAMIARWNGRPIYSIDACKNITFYDINIYSSPAAAFGSRGVSELNLLKCRVLRKRGRLVSTNADCVHIVPGRIGPWIEECLFEGQTDDAINIKTELLIIKEQIAADTYVVQNGSPIVGDRLRLYNPREGLLVGEYVVTKVARKQGQTEIVVNRELKTEKIGEKNKECDMFFNDDCSNESFVVRNNVFRNSRRYGILIQATHGVIEGNRFSGLSSPAIVLQNSAGWPEGFTPRNIVISDNEIHNCVYDYNSTRVPALGAVIVLRTMTSDEKQNAQWKGVENISIMGNNIHHNGSFGVYINGANGVIMSGNIFNGNIKEPVKVINSEGVKCE